MDKEISYRTSDPVYGETGQHTTPFGAKGEEVWHSVKSTVPGTKEYQATHPESVSPSGGSGRDAETTETTSTKGMHPTTGGTLHTAVNPVTGESTTHSTEIAAKADQIFKNAKPSIPGTVEHKATHPTGTTMASGDAATGPGYAENPAEDPWVSKE